MSAPRPNILLFFTDQQRGDTIHAGGNPVIKTPNLDRLCDEGVQFQHAYTASPVCVSARCSLIHGQYCHTTGCFDNGFPMPTDRPTLMSALAEAGYRTHGIGKMHFSPDSQARRGFQSRDRAEELRGSMAGDDYLEFLHAHGGSHIHDPHGLRGEMYYIPQPAQMPAELHATNWVGDRTVEFIREASGDQPFFLFSSFIHPHPPFSPPTPWTKLYRAPLMPLPKCPPDSEALWTWYNRHQNRYKYRDQGIDQNLLRNQKAFYYACISFIDYQVGRALAALEETGRLDDTLILFTSDHGELLGDYNCFGKRSFLDSAARIPLIARYPGRFAKGEACARVANTVDVMPTCLAAAEAQVPDQDGVDLAELAGGGCDRSFVISELQSGNRAMYGIIDERWKYLYSAPDDREFLFDRVNDPDETRDRAGLCLCEESLKETRQALIDYYKSVGFTAPLDGDGWKRYPALGMPRNPDAGLLIQDAGWAKPLYHIPGYSD